MGVGFYVGTDMEDGDSERTGAQWSYSGFNTFRHKLAKEIGINLDEMEGYCADGIRWDTINDPLRYFFHHSDCDGDLSPELCALIAPRIRALVANWPDTITLETGAMPGYPPKMDILEHDKANALKLAAGMEAAAASGKLLLFC